MPRVHPALWVCGGSAILFAVLVAALAREARPGPRVVVYAAASLRVPLDAVADDYLERTGRRVELHFGASGPLLTELERASGSNPVDLYLPADDSYLRRAEALIDEEFAIADMHAVVLTAPGNPRNITSWADLTAEGTRLAMGDPDAAAIGKVTREHLKASGRWNELRARLTATTGTVTESANAAKLGAVDAAIVWDAVANSPAYRGQQTHRLPELAGAVGHIRAAVLRSSPDRGEALAFARYLVDPGGGLPHFQRAGFAVGKGAAP